MDDQIVGSIEIRAIKKTYVGDIEIVINYTIDRVTNLTMLTKMLVRTAQDAVKEFFSNEDEDER